MDTMMILKKRLINYAKTIFVVFAISLLIMLEVFSYVKIAPMRSSHSSNPSPFQDIYRIFAPFPEIVSQMEDPIYLQSDNSIEDLDAIEIVDDFEEDPIETYISYVYQICEDETDIPNLPEIVIAMIYHESRFNPTVSNGDHIGLMQISTYWHSKRAENLGITDMWDPYSNISLGVDILKDLYYNYTNKNITLSVMMYNMDFSQAKKIYNAGSISSYAKNVFYTSQHLEEVMLIV